MVFVPFKLLDFSNADLLRRFRGALIDAALTSAVRDALFNFDTLELVPERRMVIPGLGGTITDVLANPKVVTRRVLLARRRDDEETGTEPEPDVGGVLEPGFGDDRRPPVAI